jgi:hypothetical protein
MVRIPNKPENTTFLKPDLLKLALSEGPNEYVYPSLHMKTERDQVSETLCVQFSRIPEDGQGLQTQCSWILTFPCRPEVSKILLHQ